MKVSHTIASINISGGGPSRSATTLVSALGDASAEDNFILHSLYSQEPIQTEFTQKNCSLHLHNLRFGFFENFSETLDFENADLFHGHGIWNLSIHQMAKHARKVNKPYIITPRGMLEKWSLEQSSMKKKVALMLYQKTDLIKANCLHATAEKELQNIRRLNLNNPVALIPNGISTEEFPVRTGSSDYNKRKILFLSRIHPSKGIEHLIEAWGILSENITENWCVEIVGNGKPEYIDLLNERIQAENLVETIKILPPVDGCNKIDCYHSADVFVLPTYSENFGLVVAEALSCGIPVITTKGAPWSDLIDSNCGWWIDIGTKPLADCLSEVLLKTKEELSIMGLNGRNLIEKKYSIQAVTDKMLELYKWLLGKRKKPDFVY